MRIEQAAGLEWVKGLNGLDEYSFCPLNKCFQQKNIARLNAERFTCGGIRSAHSFKSIHRDYSFVLQNRLRMLRQVIFAKGMLSISKQLIVQLRATDCSEYPAGPAPMVCAAGKGRGVAAEGRMPLVEPEMHDGLE